MAFNRPGKSKSIFVALSRVVFDVNSVSFSRKDAMSFEFDIVCHPFVIGPV